MPKIDARSYYDVLPDFAHRCGDIWRGLPTFGILRGEICAGIVVTPACDLSWRKSDTVTYLPIIPLRSYFLLDAALPMIFEKIAAAAAQTGYEPFPVFDPDSYSVPNREHIDELQIALDQYLSAQQRSAKSIGAVQRAKCGLNILGAIRDRSGDIESVDLSGLFGSEWGKIKEKIIRNSFSGALHFLPHDGQELLFSGVAFHSVVLFRYPITIPLRILNLAQEVGGREWEVGLGRLGLSDALRNSFRQEPPLKMLSLRGSFLSDLLTRFSALYNRVGSPDFTNDTVATYVEEVDK